MSKELQCPHFYRLSLDIFKDAPFYFACYYFSKTEKNEEYRKYDIECGSEYPIEAMAQLLIASAKSNFYNFKLIKQFTKFIIIRSQYNF